MRLSTIALLSTLLLAPTAALAGDIVAPSDSATQVEAPSDPSTQAAKVAPPAKAVKVERRRLTTAERWRGKPYLQSSENQSLRAQALGHAMPIDRGGLGPIGVRVHESEPLRRQALDMALPMRVQLGGF